MTEVDKPVSVPRRVSARLAAIVFASLFGILAAGYYLFLQAPFVPAFTGLRPADAAALTAQLDAKSIPYRLADGGASVLVPEARADAARVLVAASDAPMHGGVGLELFNKSDMGLSEFAQKINYQRATQGELERTIMMIDGVESARVHLAIPERSIFRAERAPPKAAVELVGRPGASLDASRIAGVQRLIANSVPDLVPADVVVIDASGRELSVMSDAASSADPLSEEQQALQHYYRARVRAALDTALPGMRVDARVATMPGTSAAEASGLEANPSARGFGLRVTVVAKTPLAPEEKERAQAAIAKAIGLDAALGDSIVFATGAPDQGAEPPAPSIQGAGMPPRVSADQPSDLPGTSWMWPVAGLFVLMVAAALIWRSRAAALSGLTARERESLVDRLRDAIANGEDRHAP